MKNRIRVGGRITSYRMFKIEQLIKSGKNYGIKDLADEFEVSPRTIQRDLDSMRELMGAPLVYDRFKKGFYYDQEFSLPKPNLNEGEIIALFLTDKLLAQLEGTPYAAYLASAGEKLRCLLTDQVSFFMEQEADFISIASVPLRGDEVKLAERFAVLEKARRQKCSVEIEHYSVQHNQLTRRVLAPYHLHLREGTWYVIGYCHLRKEVRLFALDRVSEVKALNEQFEIQPGFNIEEYLKNCWGIERGESVRVKVRFDAFQAKWIRERVWHPSQELIEREDGGLNFLAEVTGLREIKQWVLGFGEHAEVLEPVELRDEIRAEIERLRGFYARE
jgi:predicted DNA-binding transcriptional regulator YafY